MNQSQRKDGWPQRARSTIRLATASAMVAGTMLVTTHIGDAGAAAGDRALSITNVHTNETATVVYKRGGRYDPAGLKQLNYLLRDWRRNEPINMDPRLLDLVWQVYQQSGSRVPIKVVCGYRSPETNGMLRSRSRGVAKQSQHMLGKAMDFYFPDVPLAKVREIGFKMQVGGVGFYPTSGSPFVHMDTGSVRSWPRMSRDQLVRIFPDGKTLHIPSDGKPLPGYNQALAAYKARKAGADPIVMASASGGGTKSKGFLARLFGGGADEEEDNADSVAPAIKPRAVQVAAASRADKAAAAKDAAVAKAARTPAPAKAAPVVDAPPAETVVAMAPVPRRSPLPQQAAPAEAAPAIAVAAAETEAKSESKTQVALAPMPRPSPVAHDVQAEEPVVVADLSGSLPVPRISPVARPTAALASASATGGVSGRAAPAQLAAAAARQPATAAEAIADAVGKGGQIGASPMLAYAPADNGAPRIDARTGALVAGRAAARPDLTASHAEVNDDWQDPLARLTAVGYGTGTIELVTRPGSTRQKGYAVMAMPRPFGEPALFTAPERSIRLGFGRIAYEGLRTDRFSGPLVRPLGTMVFASNADYRQTVSLKR